jgi:hypothetical protein
VTLFSRSLICAAAVVFSTQAYAEADEEERSGPWQESEIVLPAAPRQENLIPLYVSAATENRFFVDGASLSVAGDGVVRYTLVVQAPEGGRNVSYEGIRCETREKRIYASGRQDGTWSKARTNQWVLILDAYANRQHAALYLEYFCPIGAIVQNADEAHDALKKGGHPLIRR